MKTRRYYIDVLKVICILCLFLAHVNAPQVMQNLRGFDVSVMVILSGLLSRNSFNNSQSIMEYLKKRIERLVIPTWIFLLLFYVCMFVVGQKPQLSDVIKSFLFQRDCGIAGGVWIIWIYLLCALLLPIIKLLSEKRGGCWIFLTLLVFNEYLTGYSQLTNNRWLYYSLFCIIPYGTLLYIGYIYDTLQMKKKIILLVSAISVHFVLMFSYILVYGSCQSISDYKYPARLYYISFGVIAFIVFYEGLKYFEHSFKHIELISFISKHSLWIYLWQIMILTVINYVLKIGDYWMISWCILVLGSIIITWIQNIIIKKLNEKFPTRFWKYFNC